MSRKIRTREIARVHIVDDAPSAREAYEYTVEDADFAAVPAAGPLPAKAEAFAAETASPDGAGLSDYRLQVGNYARYEGAVLVAAWYHLRFPALLCTRWEEAALDDIRPWRQYIPVMLTPEQLNVDTLAHGLEECVFELDEDYRQWRRPWRAQVHVLDVDFDDKRCYVEVPAWDVDRVIRVRLRDLPKLVLDELTPGLRCYADVNLGAEAFEELYFADWRLT